MSELVVRRLLVDLDRGFERQWNGGDAFRTAFFNAISMSFPVGEQFFIDAVKGGLATLPPEQTARFAEEVRGFVGQEATHRRLHGLFNAHLEKQGLVNGWGPRAARRIERLAGLDARHALGITAAYEHYTAVFAEWLLANPHWLEGAEPRLRTIWLWHSAEESEHRCTAFDLYRALGGNEKWRRRWFRVVTAYFAMDTLRQTLDNLRRGGVLWRLRTWREGARFLFGRTGLLRRCTRLLRDYNRPGFHPGTHGNPALSSAWLREHADAWMPVRGGAGTAGASADLSARGARP